MEFIRFLGLRDLMFEYWDSRCFDTCCHEFMLLMKLYLVIFFNLFLFFISFNLGEVVPYFNRW